jgi:hypothetical protein
MESTRTNILAVDLSIAFNTSDWVRIVVRFEVPSIPALKERTKGHVWS